mgnify:FL=1
MMMVGVVTVLSFLLEGIVSNIVGITSTWLVPLFSIVSLIIIYPYFNHEEGNFLKVCFAVGLFYDLVYTDTLVINACIFTLIGFFIRWLNSWMSNHAISVLFITFLTIFVYRILMYLILIVVGFLPFDLNTLVTSITSSLLLNLIYAEVLYLITDFMSKKYRIRKID